MSRTVYEGMFILDSNRFARDQEAVSGQIASTIEAAGGEMLVSRLWEDRRLAYPIKGHRKGAYWLTYFRLDGTQLTTIRRQFQLNDSVLRFLFLKVDERIVDALVEHAKSATVLSSAAPAAEDSTRPRRDRVATVESDESSDDSSDDSSDNQD